MWVFARVPNMRRCALHWGSCVVMRSVSSFCLCFSVSLFPAWSDAGLLKVGVMWVVFARVPNMRMRALH